MSPRFWKLRITMNLSLYVSMLTGVEMYMLISLHSTPVLKNSRTLTQPSDLGLLMLSTRKRVSTNRSLIKLLETQQIFTITLIKDFGNISFHTSFRLISNHIV